MIPLKYVVVYGCVGDLGTVDHASMDKAMVFAEHVEHYDVVEVHIVAEQFMWVLDYHAKQRRYQLRSNPS